MYRDPFQREKERIYQAIQPRLVVNYEQQWKERAEYMRTLMRQFDEYEKQNPTPCDMEKAREDKKDGANPAVEEAQPVNSPDLIVVPE